jgi:hypothetical protein
MKLDYGNILSRAWHITWRYRALWVFGILVALFSGGGGGGGNSTGYSFNGNDFQGRGSWGVVSQANLSAVVPWLILIGLSVALLAIVLSLIGVVLRYLSQTALIRMVDRTEATGHRLGWRDGFRLGWSRASFRLFLVDLVIGVPTAIVFVLLFVLAASPLLLWIAGDTTVGIIGTIAAIGLFVLVVLFAIAVGLILSLLTPTIYRKAVLENRGVLGSGYRLVVRYRRQAGSMWLILVGLRIAYGIILVPVALALAVVAVVIAMVPAGAVGALLYSAYGFAPARVAALLVGLPVFAIIFGVPLVWVSGLWEVFHSSSWTLTYRGLAGMGGLSDSGALPASATAPL